MNIFHGGQNFIGLENQEIDIMTFIGRATVYLLSGLPVFDK